MRSCLHFFAAALLPVLAGCVPGVAEYSKSEAPTRLRVDSATSEATLAFAPGSARLAGGEDRRLDRLVADGIIGPADRVDIAAAGPPALSAARSATISRRLLRWDIVAEARPLAGVPPNRAVVIVARSAVTLPACPNWSQAPVYDFGQSIPSWYGCDDATNLALMVASPADLIAPRPLAPPDGEPAAAAVSRYLADKIPPLPAEANMGPITAGGEGAAPGSSGGASGAAGQ